MILYILISAVSTKNCKLSNKDFNCNLKPRGAFLIEKHPGGVNYFSFFFATITAAPMAITGIIAVVIAEPQPDEASDF